MRKTLRSQLSLRRDHCAVRDANRWEFKELFAALAKLPLEQREALLLVGASGFHYDDAAAICKTAVGTIKSRVNRARKLLAELLELDDADKVGTTPASAKWRAS